MRDREVDQFRRDMADRAFPVPRYVNADGQTLETPIMGCTKRELFAAMAMQGMLSISPPGSTNRADDDFKEDMAWTARHAVFAADALLAALEANQ